MRAILYATDYSINSSAALKYAYALSNQLENHLVIIHVFDFPIFLGTEGIDEPFPHLEKNALRMCRGKLKEFCDIHLGSNWNNPKIQLEAVENKSVIKGIISKAEECHAAMILVGMKGGNSLREMIMGSTTKRLIEKAPCPVLAIPADTSYRAIKKMVYATDFEEEDIHTIKELAKIALPLNAEIKVLHICTKEEYAGDVQMLWFRDLLRKKVDYPKIKFQLLFSEDIFDALWRYLDDIGADLVVMLEREKRKLVKKWFHKDLVKYMIGYYRVPLMSFNERNHKTLYFELSG